MLKKADNFQNGMLMYRNTLPQGHTYSLAQKMFLRWTRTTLPTTEQLLAPTMIDFQVVETKHSRNGVTAKCIMTRQRESSNEHSTSAVMQYAKPCPTHRGKPWFYGEVIRNDGPRSYTICTSCGITIQRNRIQLKPAAPSPPYYQFNVGVTTDVEEMRVYPTLVPSTSKPTQSNPCLPSQPTWITPGPL